MKIDIDSFDTFNPWIVGGNDANGKVHYTWFGQLKGKYTHYYKSGKIAEKVYRIVLSGNLSKFGLRFIRRRSFQWIRFMYAWKMFWAILKTKAE